jgi:hypothetical protein
MRVARRGIDSLEYVEVTLFLDEAGVRLSESQLSRLRPYLTPVRKLEAVSGQLRTKAQVFARRGSAALAFDDTFAKLLVGRTRGRSALLYVQRYASAEMALRAFLSPDRARRDSNNRQAARDQRPADR